MRYDGDGQKSLSLLQTQAARKLAEIHGLLAPGAAVPVDPEDLRRISESRMAEMSPGERDRLRNKAVVAMSHLERLMAEMSEYLADIGEELRKVNRQSRAVGAYSQAARMGRRNSVAL
jgi:hypothetical protein